MLKKVSTLVFLCALCVWAADVWTAKPFRKDGDVFEVKLRCRRLCRCRQLPAQGQKIANRRVVIHLNP